MSQSSLPQPWLLLSWERISACAVLLSCTPICTPLYQLHSQPYTLVPLAQPLSQEASFLLASFLFFLSGCHLPRHPLLSGFLHRRPPPAPVAHLPWLCLVWAPTSQGLACSQLGSVLPLRIQSASKTAAATLHPHPSSPVGVSRHLYPTLPVGLVVTSYLASSVLAFPKELAERLASVSLYLSV